MSDILQKALAAERESSRIEFKREFNPASRAQWCEAIKDIAAIANSGGGVKFERKSLLSGIRKVTEAPRGARIVALNPTRAERISEISTSTVRAVQNPEAIPVYLTRDPKKASGTFVHESVSTALFDEINNVIDTNGILARGQKKFFLGLPVYFRIYAERRFVRGADSLRLGSVTSERRSKTAPLRSESA